MGTVSNAPQPFPLSVTNQLNNGDVRFKWVCEEREERDELWRFCHSTLTSLVGSSFMELLRGGVQVGTVVTGKRVIV